MSGLYTTAMGQWPIGHLPLLQNTQSSARGRPKDETSRNILLYILIIRFVLSHYHRSHKTKMTYGHYIDYGNQPTKSTVVPILTTMLVPSMLRRRSNHTIRVLFPRHLQWRVIILTPT